MVMNDFRFSLPLSGLVLAAALCNVGSGLIAPRGAERALDERVHHIGNDRVEAWRQMGAGVDPEGTRLDVRFQSRSNDGEWVLAITHREVDELWSVALNGNALGRIRPSKAERTTYFVLAPKALRDGDNEIAITRSPVGDDILVGPIRLYEQDLRAALSLRKVEVRVRDADSGDPIPARVTVTRADGELADIYHAATDTQAVRPGIVYTKDGAVALELPDGSYTFHATRGMEWGLAERPVTVAAGAPAPVELAIAREVDTSGFIACDTHVHTVPASDHGDATIPERLITLAGEGVELAIATDHNHHTDYRPAQREMKLEAAFTAVTGNEVTTDNGHFNCFPMDPARPIPIYKEKDWVKLVDDMRAKGAKVVVLNHPRWPQTPTSPFGLFAIDSLSGERKTGGPFTFDAMELANSGTLRDDPLELFHDWFALLNHGEHIAAVGSSDSHTVFEVVGQGRTYIRSATDDPARIDVDDACARLKRGDTSISLGIFTDVKVGGRFVMGDLVPTGDGPLDVELRVASASWILPDRARVFMNGQLAAEQPIAATAGKPTDVRLHFSLAAPPQDAWLICVVTGPGVHGQYWRTQKDYTLGATNPVFLDRDGDGRYQSPHELAAGLVRTTAADPDELNEALAHYDEAVLVQALVLARQRYQDDLEQRLRAIAGDRAKENEALSRYLQHDEASATHGPR